MHLCIDVNASLLNCYSLMAILECWPWLALVVVFIAYNWRSLLYLLLIITVKASWAPPFLETFKQINKVLQDKSLNLWNIIYALNNYIVIRYIQIYLFIKCCCSDRLKICRDTKTFLCMWMVNIEDWTCIIC